MPDQQTTAKAPLLDSNLKPRGANRSTKVAGKLKVLPEQPENFPILGTKTLTKKPTRDYENVGTTASGDSDAGDVEESEESQGDVEVCRYYSYTKNTPFSLLFQVYNQISLIPEGAARRDALRLTKKKAKSLPRVTAYATAR
jgi:hypothetical protein